MGGIYWREGILKFIILMVANLKNYRVIIQASAENRPRDHELAAAMFLAKHYFKCNITMLCPGAQKSPDLLVHGALWELKSPKGDSKNTIAHNMRNARKQSHRIILDLSRIKLHETKALAHLRAYLNKQPGKIQEVVVITKSHEVIEFYKKV